MEMTRCATSLLLACALFACSTPRRLPPVPIETLEVADASAAPPVVASASPDQATAPTPPPRPAPAAPPSTPATPAADADDVREATFRHMFRKNASGMQQNARILCLELEGNKDPSAAFLARFGDLKVPVRAGSRCTKSASGGVVDKATGARGLAFRVDSIKWSGRTAPGSSRRT